MAGGVGARRTAAGGGAAGAGPARIVRACRPLLVAPHCGGGGKVEVFFGGAFFLPLPGAWIGSSWA
jgi:hypothetical protein